MTEPSETPIVVSEVFGPTVQGEGPSAGRRCGFVRLGRCNLTCAWCDTPYTWDWKGENGTVYDPAHELERQSCGRVAGMIFAMDVNRVVLSGGEPLLQRKAVGALCALFGGMAVEIETNGTRMPLHRPIGDVAYNVSPKLANSGVEARLRIRPDVLDSLSAERAVFKFVVTGPDDLAEVDGLVQEFGWNHERIWIMPEARDAATLSQRLGQLADEVIARGYNLTGRMQVAAWGDKRGV